MSLEIFDYLNVSRLDSCIGSIEGGLYNETSQRKTNREKFTKSGGVDVNLDEGEVAKDTETGNVDERLVLDTKQARFGRVMDALRKSPRDFNYEEVGEDNPSGLSKLKVGSWVTVRCELEVPPQVRMLCQGEEIDNALTMMERFGPLMKIAKPETELPSAEQISAVRALSSFKVDPAVVGIVDDDYPKIVGKLSTKYLEDELPEGEKWVFGKVTNVWGVGTSYPILALPGASLLSREQRRKTPKTSSNGDTLTGPGVTLEIIAIYT